MIYAYYILPSFYVLNCKLIVCVVSLGTFWNLDNGLYYSDFQTLSKSFSMNRPLKMDETISAQGSLIDVKMTSPVFFR